jgi:hypothetical protein
MSSAESHFRKSQAAIERFFDKAHVSIYTATSLHAAIAQHRSAWHLGRVAIADIAELLLDESRLKLVRLGSAHYAPISRYTWGSPSPFELALSLRPNSYLSHGTAAYLHGFLGEAPTTFYLNKEQSPKEQRGTLTQDGLDRAFTSRPRQSNFVFSDQAGHRFVIIAGKFTNYLGVGPIKGPAGEKLYATAIERTLVDMVVRPVYCGGVGRVLEAYRAARQLSAKRLMATLKRLGHLYPYHQAIGFYLERAGFAGEALDLARQPGLAFDFYLTHGMDDTAYDKTWRVHYPRGL